MTHLRPIILAASLLVLNACTSVLIEKPFKPASPPVDKENLEGVWSTDKEGFQFIHFMSNGVGKIVVAQWKGDEFGAHDESGEFITAAGTRRNYFCGRLIEERTNAMPAWAFGAYKLTGDDKKNLLIWYANVDYFKTAVQAHKIDGVVEVRTNATGRVNSKQNVMLHCTPEALLKFLDDPKNEGAFDFTEPQVMHKVSNEPK